MEDNKILRYLSKINNTYGNEEETNKLKEEGAKEQVTLSQVGFALHQIIQDLLMYTDASQSVGEVKLMTVVESLPDDLKYSAFKAFEKVDNGLFELPNDQDYEKESENE